MKVELSEKGKKVLKGAYLVAALCGPVTAYGGYDLYDSIPLKMEADSIRYDELRPLNTHLNHGGYDIILIHHDNKELVEIFLKCPASSFRETERKFCPHQNPKILSALRNSIVFQNREYWGGVYTKEVELQAQKREEFYQTKDHIKLVVDNTTKDDPNFQ